LKKLPFHLWLREPTWLLGWESLLGSWAARAYLVLRLREPTCSLWLRDTSLPLRNKCDLCRIWRTVHHTLFRKVCSLHLWRICSFWNRLSMLRLDERAHFFLWLGESPCLFGWESSLAAFGESVALVHFEKEWPIAYLIRRKSAIWPITPYTY